MAARPFSQRTQAADAAVLYEQVTKAAESRDAERVKRAATDLEEKFGLGPGFDTYERHGLFGWDHPTIKPRADAARELEDRAAQEAVGRALQAEHPELFDIGRPTAPEVVDRSLEWLRAEVAEDFRLDTHPTGIPKCCNNRNPIPS